MAKYEMLGPDGRKYEYETDDSKSIEEVEADFTYDWNLQHGGENPTLESFKPDDFQDDWKRAQTTIERLPEEQRLNARAKYADYIAERERAADVDGVDLGSKDYWKSVGQYWNDLGRQVARNLPGGEFADEGRAALQDPSLGPEYEHRMDVEEAKRRAIAKRNKTGMQTQLDTEKKLREKGVPVIGDYIGRPPSVFDALGITPGGVAQGAGVAIGSVPFVRAGKYISQGASTLWNARPIIMGALGLGTSSAVQGGLDAAGTQRGDLGERAEAGAKGALISGAGGAILGGVGGKIAKNAAERTFAGGVREQQMKQYDKYAAARLAGKNPRKVPTRVQADLGDTISELSSKAQKRYADAENLGVRFSGANTHPTTNMTFAEDLQDRVNRAMIDAGLNPTVNNFFSEQAPNAGKIRGFLQRITDGRNISLNDLEGFRSALVNYTRDTSEKPLMRKIAGASIEAMDDFLGSIADDATLRAFLGPNTNPKQFAAAKKALEEARNLWKTSRKSEVIRDALENARVGAMGNIHGGNEAAQMRAAFGRILKNKRHKNVFTEAERELMTDVMGSGKIGRSLLRRMAAWNPLRSFLGGAGLGGMAAQGAPGSAAVGAGVSGAADTLENLMTQGSVDTAVQAISATKRLNRGPAKPQLNRVLQSPGKAAAIKSIARELARSGAYSDPNRPLTDAEMQYLEAKRLGPKGKEPDAYEIYRRLKEQNK